jgi:hypothetical protein
MKKVILLVLLVSVTTCAFASNGVKSQSPSTGILIVATFDFLIVGDGISTTLTVTPTRVPPIYADGVAVLPNLPLVGVVGEGQCNEPFTATVSGNQVIMNFATAPPAGVIEVCSVNLTYQPQ